MAGRARLACHALGWARQARTVLPDCRSMLVTTPGLQLTEDASIWQLTRDAARGGPRSQEQASGAFGIRCSAHFWKRHCKLPLVPSRPSAPEPALCRPTYPPLAHINYHLPT